jgi:hypothetical protein
MAATSQFDPPPTSWLPAWVVSFAFHAAAIVLLVMALERVPLGGTADMGGTMEIVLNNTSTAGDASPGDSAPANIAAPPPPIAVEAPTEPTPAPTSPTVPVAAPSQPASNASSNAAPQVQAESVLGGRYGPPGEGQAQVRVFGVKGVGKKFVYLFDRSTRMEGPPLATAKQQLIQSLQSLDNLHQFHIIFFNQQQRHFSVPGAGRRIPFATDRNKQLATKFVGGITADGGTDRLPALHAAIAIQPDVIFFLTDAVDRMPESELEDLERLNRRAGATICTIEFGTGPRTTTSNFLTELAARTGGQYGYVDTLRLEP